MQLTGHQLYFSFGVYQTWGQNGWSIQELELRNFKLELRNLELELRNFEFEVSYKTIKSKN
jgi:hypothetical protein